MRGFTGHSSRRQGDVVRLRRQCGPPRRVVNLPVKLPRQDVNGAGGASSCRGVIESSHAFTARSYQFRAVFRGAAQAQWGTGEPAVPEELAYQVAARAPCPLDRVGEGAFVRSLSERLERDVLARPVDWLKWKDLHLMTAHGAASSQGA